MSTIGPGVNAASPMAGSFAAAQRADADADQRAVAAAERKRAADLQAMLARWQGDVAEADLATDRDADGRLPESEGRAAEGKEVVEPGPTTGEVDAAPDALGERGTRLDLRG